MSKIIDAQDTIADARDWMARFFQGRSQEEIERIKAFAQAAFPPPAQAAPSAKPGSRAPRTNRRSK
jgi:hypothetical protein